jgi:hypothetical protein
MKMEIIIPMPCYETIHLSTIAHIIKVQKKKGDSFPMESNPSWWEMLPIFAHHTCFPECGRFENW